MKKEVVYCGNKIDVEIEKDFEVVTEGCIEKGDKTLYVGEGFKPARPDQIGENVLGYYCVIRKIDPSLIWERKKREREERKLEKKVVGKWYAHRVDTYGMPYDTIQFKSLEQYRKFLGPNEILSERLVKELSDSEIEALAWARTKIKKEVDRICMEADVELMRLNKKMQEVIRYPLLTLSCSGKTLRKAIDEGVDLMEKIKNAKDKECG